MTAPRPLSPGPSAPWKASEKERGVVCAPRWAAASALDDFTLAGRHFRQRALGGKMLSQVVAERLEDEPEFARATPYGRVGPCAAIEARLFSEAAKEVSQPDN